MNNLLRTLTTLLNSQQHNPSVTTSLVLERLYYADGRHNPSHPQHGRFDGLSLLT
ncbi:cyanate hydratase [Synechococcus sp. UW179A]|uniref:cyanate hydratase n=1 Tax=Synechococcus sp. UW179A TaxID=2575510 RepID=UPI000E0F4DA0|nr:cyanate hydratase [Synechococcus sp. UW179A]